MGSEHLGIGAIGEDIACKYLKDKGYKIIDRNVRKKWGELDIVSRAKDGTLVFLEVKTLKAKKNREDSFTPEQNYSFDKARKTQRIAQSFANQNHGLIGKAGYRIDLITVLIYNPLLTDLEKDCVVRHYENVS